MKYFKLREFTRSSAASRLGIENNPSGNEIKNIESLVHNVLDPLREWYGRPININSGYRSRALNDAVKGSNTSQHMTGQAADISVGSPAENKKLFEYIRVHLPFDQLINEYDYSWVHVSYKDAYSNRKQVLKIG